MNELRIAIIGDFDSNSRTHPRTNEAIEHAAAYIDRTISISWIATEGIERNAESILEDCAAIMCSPGSPYRSAEGAIAGIRFARERGYPFAGT